MFTHRGINQSEGEGRGAGQQVLFTKFTEDTKLNFHRQSDRSAYAINEAYSADLFSISFMNLIVALKRVLSLNATVSVSSEFALHLHNLT